METENAQIIMFSGAPLGFYPKAWIDDGGYKNPPAGLIELTEKEVASFRDVTAPPGKMLGVVKGRPAWVDLPAPTKDQLKSIADAKRDALIAEANEITADWRTELALGVIEDVDKVKLTAWMKYIKEVKGVDTSEAPVGTWPEQPEK